MRGGGATWDLLALEADLAVLEADLPAEPLSVLAGVVFLVGVGFLAEAGFFFLGTDGGGGDGDGVGSLGRTRGGGVLLT